MKLKDDADLIEKYKQAHAKEHFWPEITQGMKEVGILDMEIYISDNRLFMIMDTVADFDHEKAMQALGNKPRQAEWEAYVSNFQQAGEGDSSDEKWQLMERIYELDQDEEYRAAEGQLKSFKKK